MMFIVLAILIVTFGTACKHTESMVADNQGLAPAMQVQGNFIAQPNRTVVLTQNIEVDWVNTFSFGGGYNALSSQATGSCLKSFEVVHEEGQIPLETVWKWEEVKTSEELRKHLGITATGSYRGPTVSVSMKADFARREEMREDTIKFLGYQKTVTKTPKSIIKLVLDDRLEGLSPTEFVNRCGTHVIVGQILGGEMFGIASFFSTSSQERQEARLALSVSGTNFDIGVQAGTDEEKTKRLSKLVVRGSKSGGDVRIFLSTAEFKEEMKSFRNQLNVGPMFPVTAIMRPWSQILPEITFDERFAKILRLVELYNLYLDAENIFKNLQLRPSGFYVKQDGNYLDMLKTIEIKLYAEVDKVLKKINVCANIKRDLSDCDTSDLRIPIPAPTYGFPVTLKDSCDVARLEIPQMTRLSALHWTSPNTDKAMASDDVAQIVTSYTTNAAKTRLDQQVALTIKETSGNAKTEYSDTVTRLVWSWEPTRGCTIGQYPDTPITSSFSSKGEGEKDYPIQEEYIKSAKCTLDPVGTDKDNFSTGCSEINFEPIWIHFKHTEDLNNAPSLAEPKWLQ